MVSGWFGWITEPPTRATLPPEDRVDLRYLLSGMWNVVTSYLRLICQAGEQQCTLLEMREKMPEEANAILLWGGH